MKKILFVITTFVAVSFASCGGSTTGSGLSPADSIRQQRLQDSLDALQQAEQEALEVEQAQKAALDAALNAAKAK